MGNLSNEAGAAGAGNPVVDRAVRSLRAFGDDLDRAAAARLLPMWWHYAGLSGAEREAVLARFDAPGSVVPGGEPVVRVDPGRGVGFAYDPRPAPVWRIVMRTDADILQILRDGTVVLALPVDEAGELVGQIVAELLASWPGGRR